MKYFTISEMLRSDTALKMRIWNGATLEHEENMRALIENLLDPLREQYGHPIEVSSGYRCPKLNAAVNGAPNSQHMRGEAADIYAKGSVPSAAIPSRQPSSQPSRHPLSENLKLAQLIAASGNFDQMILEEVGPNDLNPRWIHASYKRNGWNRKNILKKVAGKAGYVTVKPEELLEKRA